MGTMARYSLTTSFPAISITAFVRGRFFEGGDKKGVFEHPCGFHVAVSVSGCVVTLRYERHGEKVSSSFTTETMAMNLGGRRRFFVCPRCGRWYTMLFLSCGGAACRQCLHLKYPSSRQRAYGRAILKKKTMLHKLGVDSWLYSWEIERPKWMHQDTFERKRQAIEAVEHEAGGEWMAQASAFLLRHCKTEH